MPSVGYWAMSSATLGTAPMLIERLPQIAPMIISELSLVPVPQARARWVRVHVGNLRLRGDETAQSIRLLRLLQSTR